MIQESEKWIFPKKFPLTQILFLIDNGYSGQVVTAPDGVPIYHLDKQSYSNDFTQEILPNLPLVVATGNSKRKDFLSYLNIFSGTNRVIEFVDSIHEKKLFHQKKLQ